MNVVITSSERKRKMNSSLQMAQAVVFVIFLMAFGAAVSYLVNKALDNAEAKNKIKRKYERQLAEQGEIIEQLHQDVEFWKGNCETAEQMYTKLRKEFENENKI